MTIPGLIQMNLQLSPQELMIIQLIAIVYALNNPAVVNLGGGEVIHSSLVDFIMIN